MSLFWPLLILAEQSRKKKNLLWAFYIFLYEDSIFQNAQPYGDGSTDLRFTSRKLKIVNCWLYSPMHKKNLYFNNKNKLYFTKIYF